MTKQVKTLIAVGVVLLALAAAVALLLLGAPAGGPEESSLSSGVSQALFTHEAADISAVTVKGGGAMSFTGDGEGSVAANGMEGLPLDESALSYVAKYSASLTGQEPVEAGDDLAQFGLGAGAATVEVSYKDGSSESFAVGGEVPGSSPSARYVLYDGAVWTAYSTHVKYFLYTDLDFIPKTVTPASKDSAGSTTLYEVKGLEMGGASRETPFTVKYTDTVSASGMSFTNYAITSPGEWSFTYRENGMTLLFSPFDITADEVVLRSPTEEELAEYGLAEPYATVKLSSILTSDGSACDFTLKASEPRDGSIYLMREGVPVIYKTALPAEASWYGAVYTDYINSLLLVPNIKDVATASLTAPQGDYKFVLNYTVPESDPSASEEPAEELTTVTASSTFPGAARSAVLEDMDAFRDFYQLLISAAQEEWTDDVPEADALVPVLRITYSYRGGGSEYLEFYEGPARQVYVGANGNVHFLTRSSTVDSILEGALALVPQES